MLSLRGSVIVSACFHAGVFIAFLVFSSVGGAKLIYKPGYEVTLVSPGELAAPGKSRGSERKAVPPPVKPEVTAPPVPEKKPEVSTAPKEENKKPEPKPAEQPKEKVDKEKAEKERLAKEKVDSKQDEELLGDVLARIKKKVGKSGQMTASKGDSSGGGWGERQREIQYQTYLDQVYQIVRGNWNPPPDFDMNKKEVMTVASISILPDGGISNTYIEQSSGDPLFDQSVMRAIFKSNPLPPPPIGLEQQTYELGLNFLPLTTAH